MDIHIHMDGQLNETLFVRRSHVSECVINHLFSGSHRMAAGETTEMRYSSKCQLVDSLASQQVQGYRK